MQGENVSSRIKTIKDQYQVCVSNNSDGKFLPDFAPRWFQKRQSPPILTVASFGTRKRIIENDIFQF